LPDADMLVQTMHDDARIGQALRAGATGYLIKSATSLQQYKQVLLNNYLRLLRQPEHPFALTAATV